MIRICSIGLMVALLCCPEPGRASELLLEADVLRSEPVLDKTESQRCDEQKRVMQKPMGRDLITWLSWDLCTGDYASISTSETLRGYRVYYRWDNQVFSQFVTTRPGDTIPIRVNVR